MKKILTGLAAFVLTLSFASAEVKFSFYNKLYEEGAVAVHDDSADETVKDFPAIREKMYAEILTDRVDAMIEGTFAIDDFDDSHFGLQGEVDDWYIEFRPIHMITLGLHTGIFADGSYLPIWDDNVASGNIGSDGFTVTVRPVENFRISVTAPFSFDGDPDGVNWVNGKEEWGEDEKFNVGFGAIFDAEFFQIGASLHDIADSDERELGAFINIPGLFGAYKPLTVGAGFSHSWGNGELESLISVCTDTAGDGIDGGIAYKNLMNAYAELGFEKFTLTAELAYNLGDDDHGTHDIYTAASVSVTPAEKVTATATGKLLSDFTSSSKGKVENILFAGFALDFDVNDNNTIGAEFDFATQDSNWAIAVPVYWKYQFEN
ncbi:hypothetical protein [Treponema sp.]|uniref:hypothetical protein n=1 Tax=Treponema sp. TaxID=166 RepID=UPI00388D63C9